ncbi:hypothetical protein AAE478_004465 [Parahypoxylon ruwenzoriense]
MSPRDRPLSVADYEPVKPNARRAVDGGYGSLPSKSKYQESWDTVKLVLRIMSFIIGLGLLGVSLALFVAPKGFSSHPILGTSLAAAALLYDFAEFITSCARNRKSGIKPSVSLGFELVLSIGGLVLSALLVIYTMSSWEWNAYYTTNRSGGTHVPNFVTDGYLWFGLAIAVNMLCFILSLIHLVLFVRDCVEVDRERKAKKALKTAHALQAVREAAIASYATADLDSQGFSRILPETTEMAMSHDLPATTKPGYAGALQEPKSLAPSDYAYEGSQSGRPHA